jgi:hypothetical protein
MGTRKVILVTYGALSKTDFILLEHYHAWLQTIPVDERPCVLVTETNLDESDLEFLQRSKMLINKHDQVIAEIKLDIGLRLRSKKPA